MTIVAAMDWDRATSWRIARSDGYDQTATAKEFLFFPDRYLTPRSHLVVESPHLAPRTRSKAQVYLPVQLRELEKRFEGLQVTAWRFPHRIVRAYAPYVEEGEWKNKDKNERNKNFDYLYLLRLVCAEGLPEKRWFAPTPEDEAAEERRNVLRADVKEMLNLARVNDYEPHPLGSYDPRVDERLKDCWRLLGGNFHRIPREVKQAGWVSGKASFAMQIKSKVKIFSAYALVYDLDGRLRCPERFSSRWLVNHLVGLNVYGYPNQIRATFCYHGGGRKKTERDDCFDDMDDRTEAQRRQRKQMLRLERRAFGKLLRFFYDAQFQGNVDPNALDKIPRLQGDPEQLQLV